MKNRMYKYNIRHRRFDPAICAFLLLLVLSMALLYLTDRHTQNMDVPPVSGEVLKTATDAPIIDDQITEPHYDSVIHYTGARPILLNAEKLSEISETDNVTVIGNLIRSSVCDALDSCTQLLHSIIFDTEPPVIVLKGSKKITMQVGSESVSYTHLTLPTMAVV